MIKYKSESDSRTSLTKKMCVSFSKHKIVFYACFAYEERMDLMEVLRIGFCLFAKEKLDNVFYVIKLSDFGGCAKFYGVLSYHVHSQLF